MGGLVAGAALAAFVSKSVFDIPVWMTFVAVACLGARHDCLRLDWGNRHQPHRGYGQGDPADVWCGPEAPRRT